MYIPRPAKLLFTVDDARNRFLARFEDRVTPWTRLCVERILACGTRAMLRWARKQGIDVGVFCALHTYGRQLNQHPHIHLSVTRSGLDVKHGVWRDIFF